MKWVHIWQVCVRKNVTTKTISVTSVISVVLFVLGHSSLISLPFGFSLSHHWLMLLFTFIFLLFPWLQEATPSQDDVERHLPEALLVDLAEQHLDGESWLAFRAVSKPIHAYCPKCFRQMTFNWHMFGNMCLNIHPNPLSRILTWTNNATHFGSTWIVLAPWSLMYLTFFGHLPSLHLSPHSRTSWAINRSGCTFLSIPSGFACEIECPGGWLSSSTIKPSLLLSCFHWRYWISPWIYFAGFCQPHFWTKMCAYHTCTTKRRIGCGVL